MKKFETIVLSGGGANHARTSVRPVDSPPPVVGHGCRALSRHARCRKANVAPPWIHSVVYKIVGNGNEIGNRNVIAHSLHSQTLIHVNLRPGLHLFTNICRQLIRVVAMSSRRSRKRWGRKFGSHGGGGASADRLRFLERGSWKVGLGFGSSHISGRIVICSRCLLGSVEGAQPFAFFNGGISDLYPVRTPWPLSHAYVIHFLRTFCFCIGH